MGSGSSELRALADRVRELEIDLAQVASRLLKLERSLAVGAAAREVAPVVSARATEVAAPSTSGKRKAGR